MKWQYWIADFASLVDDREKIHAAEQGLDKFGNEGWEAVSVWTNANTTFVLFKKLISK